MKIKQEDSDLSTLINNANNYLKGNNKTIALNLLEKLLFMEEVLIKLKNEINNNGVIENFKNGKQNFIRESSALKSYNNTLKNYQKLINQVSEMIPNELYKSPIDD